MAPIAVEPIDPTFKDVEQPKIDNLELPATAKTRLERAGIDISVYPYRPAKPIYLDDVYNLRSYDRPFLDAGTRADKTKSSLFAAATEVIHLTAHIGTEIRGLQLKDLTDQQKDELALLIAERSVVFFRDQDITPQQQKALGEYFGEIEIHVSIRK
jgi:Taurine catabolism dioxygenase TauD, TfdA family